MNVLLGLFEASAPRFGRGISADGQSCHPPTTPPHEPPQGEDKQEAEAQDIGAERQKEIRDDDGRTAVIERPLYK